MALRPDLAIIADNVASGARVLDVGCGDGALMAELRRSKRVDARGLEIDGADVTYESLCGSCYLEESGGVLGAA